MLAPKALLDALSDQASRLFSSDTAQPRAELESQFKVLMQGAFSKLDLVSREEFDSQMVVLARTRTRLEALEKQVAELEARLNPAAQDEQMQSSSASPSSSPQA
ncbi:accessory factor UbiK family protein [Pseudomonas putida]|uniref:accessory factor UbiK family protein n=1 Tax=Pseudomonas putida TaxID=303 RepID=UPI00300F24AA